MRDCLKASETNNMVSLPAASGNYVMSSKFLTVDLEAFEFTKVSIWVTVFMWLDSRECHSLSRFKKGRTAQLAVLQTTAGS